MARFSKFFNKKKLFLTIVEIQRITETAVFGFSGGKMVVGGGDEYLYYLK